MHRYQQPQAPSRRPGRLPVAVKREAAEAKSTRLRVFTEAEKDEIGIATLLGEYTELGMNHGRPTFQKVENAGSEVNVFVYYWDTRDGPEFSGWWFGDKVGGTQVWSRAMDSGKAPPRKGWRVPWDGDEQQGLLLVEVMDTTAAMAQPVSASNGPRHASLLKQEPDPDQRVMAERVKLAMERIVAAEAEVEQAITSTKETLSGEELDESSLLETDSILRTQLDNVQSEQKHLAKELAEGRAAGGTQTSLGDLARLAPRVRQLAVSVGSQLTHVQAALTKVRQQAMLAKQKASAAEVAAEREQKDAASLQAILPEAMDIVTAAEDAVETVAILAAAVSVDETDTSETHKAKAIQDIEKCASKAQGDLLEAKKLVNGHMAACKKYAPEAQKVAIQEFAALEKRLNEAAKRLTPLKRFRQEHEQKAAARKALMEISQKLSSAELEIEKAHIMTSTDSQMEQDDITSTAQLLGPAEEDLKNAKLLIAKRLNATSKDDLEELHQRVADASAKLTTIRQVLARQEEALAVERALSEVHEKIEQAEEAYLATSEAEMPFLKGLEVLPIQEGMQAVAQCEAACERCEGALDVARKFLNKVETESKTKWSKEGQKHLAAELKKCRDRGEETHQKLRIFKKETRQRKAKAMLQEVSEKVAEAENQSQALAEVVKVLSAELDKVTVEALKLAIDQSIAAEKEAVRTYNAAREVMSAKQKEVKDPPLLMELTKLQKKLASAHQEMVKSRQIAKGGEQLIKDKKVVLEEERKVGLMETLVEKAEKMMPAEDQDVKKEELIQIDSAIKSANAAVHASQRSLDKHLAGDTSAKACLSKLVSRVKEAATKMEKIKKTTKTQREKASAEVIVKAAEQHVEAVEAALQKVAEAELPFLKGIEVIPLSEASSAIAECEQAAKQVQEALERAKSLIATKTIEAKKFAEVASKPCLERLALQVERINAAAAKLSQFRKDTESHKRTSQMHEAAEMLKKAEEEVEKTIEAGAPLDTEDLSITPEAATEVCAKLGHLEKAANKTVTEALVFLAERRKDVKGTPKEVEIDEKCENLRQEAKRIREVIDPLNSTADLEAVATPSSILRDGEQMSAKLADEMAAVRKFIEEHEAPKSAEGCATQIKQLLASAVSKLDALGKLNAQHMKVARSSALKVGQAALRKAQQAMRTEALRRELGVEALFDEMAGEGEVARSAMQRRLESLELSLSSEQVALLLDTIMESSSEDAVISRWRFLRNFQQFYECQKNIALTTDFVISNCKPKRSLNASEVVEVLEGPQRDEKLGIERIRGRAMRDNLEGWVSISGNQGTAFLKERPKPFVVCLIDLPLEKDFLSSGEPPIRLLKADEVLEHLEGPRSDTSEALMRARCKALSDDATGWITLTSQQQVTAEKGHQKFFSCKNGVAITDGPNIKACKVFRKLEAGEVIRLLEGPEVDKDSGVTRIKAACLKDGLEGWVTTLGNAGTLYAEEQTQYYTVLCEAPLQKAKHSTSETVRALRRDEAIEVLEGPVEFTPEITERLKARAVNDGAMGWVTATTKRLKRWYPTYMCKQSTVLQDTLATKSANLVRRVEEGEVLEVLDGPKEDAEAGLLRVRAKARKDQAIGWITLRGNQGTLFLAQWTARDEQLAKQPKEQKEKEQKEEKEEKKVATSKV
ncbi:unnamed protein product [Effrenium voratum]|uniref:Uncharacterized protein n=1 Tax=Effrenium voratum TaxID=2562239 RepID=A0AA36I9S5_9DINO|nr:unnamed protein product [Effrenium voratum]